MMHTIGMPPKCGTAKHIMYGIGAGKFKNGVTFVMRSNVEFNVHANNNIAVYERKLFWLFKVVSLVPITYNASGYMYINAPDGSLAHRIGLIFSKSSIVFEPLKRSDLLSKDGIKFMDDVVYSYGRDKRLYKVISTVNKHGVALIRDELQGTTLTNVNVLNLRQATDLEICYKYRMLKG